MHLISLFCLGFFFPPPPLSKHDQHTKKYFETCHPTLAFASWMRCAWITGRAAADLGGGSDSATSQAPNLLPRPTATTTTSLLSSDLSPLPWNIKRDKLLPGASCTPPGGAVCSLFFLITLPPPSPQRAVLYGGDPPNTPPKKVRNLGRCDVRPLINLMRRSLRSFFLLFFSFLSWWSRQQQKQ